MQKLIVVLIVATLCSLGCGDDSKNKKPDYHDKIQAKFHTKDNPGKWKKQADKHVPEITVKKKDKKYHISVVVPFVATRVPIHYTEAILLLDHNHNELQKVTFDKWAKVASATFVMPGDYKSFLYIVVKCNLHDMWKKQFVLE